MDQTSGAARHPFLEDLSDGVTLLTNVLPNEVRGKNAVLTTIRTGAQIYARQTTTYQNHLSDGRSLIEYDAELIGGQHVHAVVLIDWDEARKVTRLNIGFAPLDGAIAFSSRLEALLRSARS